MPAQQMTGNYRGSFALGGGIYLLSHSVGCPPRNTTEAWTNAFLQPWHQGNEDTWTHWLDAIDTFRAAVATLLGADSSEICPQTNLSSALTKVISSRPFDLEKPTILFTEADFPSMGFVLEKAQAAGYTARSMPIGLNFTDTEVWSDYLTDDVGLVLITHVHSNTSIQVPVAEICALSRERGVSTVVDIAQSAGVVPISMPDWKADFVIGSCVKWLCGGPGAGFLWVNPTISPQCQPTDVGWFSHEDPFEFDINNFRYATDALKFWGGTPSVQPYVVANNSVRILLDIGIEKVREHNIRLSQLLMKALPSEYLASPVEADLRGGTVVIAYPDDALEMRCNQLRKAGVAFDQRPSGIRLSPHIYNTDEEIAQIVALSG